MSKYAPPNDAGLKPWVVTISEWGRKRETVIYAKTNADARYQAAGRSRYATATARRATPADLESQPA